MAPFDSCDVGTVQPLVFLEGGASPLCVVPFVRLLSAILAGLVD